MNRLALAAAAMIAATAMTAAARDDLVILKQPYLDKYPTYQAFLEYEFGRFHCPLKAWKDYTQAEKDQHHDCQSVIGSRENGALKRQYFGTIASDQRLGTTDKWYRAHKELTRPPTPTPD